MPITVERLSAMGGSAGAAGHHAMVGAELINASRTGLGFVAAEAFDADEIVRVTLHFDRETDAGRQFSLEGTVRICIPEHKDHFRTGVFLHDMSLHDLQLWHDMIERWRLFVWA